MSKITKQELNASFAAELETMKNDAAAAKTATGTTIVDSLDLFEATNVETALRELALRTGDLKIIRSAKDVHGTFTTVEYRRKSDDKLYMRYVLSEGTAPRYTKRTHTYYRENGNVLKTVVFTLAYDAAGALVSET